MHKIDFKKFQTQNYFISKHGSKINALTRATISVTFEQNLKTSLRPLIWYFLILTGKKPSAIKTSRVRSSEKQTLVGLTLQLTGSDLVIFLDKLSNFLIPNQEIDQVFKLRSNNVSLNFKKCLTYAELDKITKNLVKFNLNVIFTVKDFLKIKNFLQMLQLPVC